MTAVRAERSSPAAETAYGHAKRLAFVATALADGTPGSVLDVGCGTGRFLTAPLAAMYPGIRFVGIDTDRPSIDVARAAPPLSNLEFRLVDDALPREEFDFIICSEVLEHVDDPVGFLGELRQRLRPGGRLVVTVPNGYGPMECVTLIETMLRLTGAYAVLRRCVRALRGKRPAQDAAGAEEPDSHAISPHVNFLTRAVLGRIFGAAGFRPTAFSPRTVFCGLGFDQLIGLLGAEAFNARLADRLPAAFASDWMYVLDVVPPGPGYVYRRRPDARLRRFLNAKRWGLRPSASSAGRPARRQIVRSGDDAWPTRDAQDGIMTDTLNPQVQAYWEAETCGTGDEATAGLERFTPEWFAAIEANRYRLEPYIHDIAEFPRHAGKEILEVGVGAGTDHLQWARAGCACHGVDLTEAAIETTRRHLAVHGFSSDLRHLDAETLPFADATFDLVYSWGVIHHSTDPAAIVAEIRRVLKPRGLFVGMMYHRRSVAVARLWVRHALLAGRPWRGFADVAWHHIESVGTKIYTIPELRALFGDFASFDARSLVTHSDEHRIPSFLARSIPDRWGFFAAIRAVK